MKYDVFFSYSSKDEKLASRLYKQLTVKKYKVWLDKQSLSVGDNIAQRVFDGIGHARYFCIILTRNSSESNWVKRELSTAVIQELEVEDFMILPLLFRGGKLPRELSNKKFADFTFSFKQGWKELLNALTEGKPKGVYDKKFTLLTKRKKATTTEQKNKKKLLIAIRKKEDLYLVMDLGGTKAYCAIVNREATNLVHKKFPTEHHKDPEKLFSFIKRCIRETIDHAHEICKISTDEVSRK